MDKSCAVVLDGVARPRSRGARRRLPPTQPTATAFPSLLPKRSKAAPLPSSAWGAMAATSSLAPISAIGLTGALQQQQRAREESRESPRGPSREANALRDRLHATGVKRSVVQAQLFPGGDPKKHVSNQEESDQRGALLAKRPGGIKRSNGPMATGFSNQEPVLDHTPLVPSLALHPTGGVLIPCRPTTSTAMHRPPGKPSTAREILAPGRSQATDMKVPMSARDRYYVEQRAMTAPSRSRPLNSSEPAKQDSLKILHPQPTTAQYQAPVPYIPHNTVSKIDPTQVETGARRSDLLAQSSQFKTLTEMIAEHLVHAADSSAVGGSGAFTVARDSFLYLKRVDSNPYNLVLTNHAGINPNDYYTVSRLGITNFSNNSSEFMPLEKFEREKYLYSLIIQVCSSL